MIISPSSLILSSPPWIPVSSQASPFHFHKLIFKFYSITLAVWPTAFSQGVGYKAISWSISDTSVYLTEGSDFSSSCGTNAISSPRWISPFLTNDGLFVYWLSLVLTLYTQSGHLWVHECVAMSHSQDSAPSHSSLPSGFYCPLVLCSLTVAKPSRGQWLWGWWCQWCA